MVLGLFKKFLFGCVLTENGAYAYIWAYVFAHNFSWELRRLPCIVK